jgi:branched-chain amino acid transport system substrate-binding protein
MKKRILLISVGLLLAVLSMTWVGTGFTQPEIRIGVVGGFTGGQAPIAEAHKRGLVLRLEQIGYKISGRPVKVFYEDCKEEVAPTVEKVRKLVEGDRVHILLGPLFGSGIAAIADYMKKKGIPWLPTAASGEQFTSANPAHFAPNYGWHQLGGISAPYAYRKMGARTAVVITNDYSYGHLLGGIYKDTFEKEGGKVLKYIALPLPEPDYRPYLMGMPTADVALVFTTGFPAVRFVKQYVELNFQKKTPVLGAMSALDTLYRAEMGKESVGMRYVTHWDPDLDIPENNAYVRDLRARYPEITAIGYYDMSGFLSIRIIEEALKTIGGDVENSARFAKAISAVDFPSPLGRYRFDPEIRAPLITFYVFEIVEKDGKFPSKLIDKIPDVRPILPKPQK